MSVLDGYNKYKRYIKTNDGYKLCSQWTSSNTVQMDDGNTLQTNLGAINGITDSLTATSSNIAASAAAVKTLNDSLNKEWTRIFSTTDLTGYGTIPNFTNYKEIIIIICANGFYQTHHVSISWLPNSLIPFVGSWYYSGTGTNAMATIGLDKNGNYSIGKGISQNTNGSTISIYAR